MADRVGFCTNLGNCSKADRGEKIRVPLGAQFSCPECKRDLAEARRSGGGSRSTLFVIIFVVLLLLGFLAYGFRRHWFGGSSPAATEHSSAAVLLRLHGSNTIGEKLAPALAEKFLAVQGFQNIRRVPGSDPVEVTIEGTAQGESEPKVIEIKAHGTATAFESMEKGLADIGMASRRIKPGEKSSLSAQGDMTSPACEHVLGLDGLAVVVNSANPIDTLSLEQVRKIFTGEISNWSAVGAPSAAITLYARNDKSGTFDTFKDTVLHGARLGGSAKRYENSDQLSDDVSADTNGIGFIGLPFVKNCKALKLSEGDSVPMVPNRFTVRTEDYILSRRLYLYTAAVPQNPIVHKFIDFAISDVGQQIVDEQKFIGQASPVPIPPQPSLDQSSEYARFTAGAQRLDLDFRFQTGKAVLDNKALVDLGRLVEKMDREFKGHRILLFGFADGRGRPDANLRLSEERATTVRQELIGRGISPEFVKGFGQQYPVASNETDDGREKNRRVEVWLR